MDWKECTKIRFAKQVSKDKNLIESLKKKAEKSMRASDLLPLELADNKVTAMYDAMRELLECLALNNGYKIYNHECYTAFLKEVLGMDKEAETFDKIRKTRNGINYYDKSLDEGEAKDIIGQMKDLIGKIKKMLENL